MWQLDVAIKRNIELNAVDLLDVSIVIPMRNARTTIEQQLHSLACQTFTGAWEVIVVDNGSTDNSAAIAIQCSDLLPRLRVIKALEKRGPAYARNVGTRVARGKLILYCDADDEVTEGWLAAMWRAYCRGASFLAACEDHGTLSDGKADIRPIALTKEQFPFLPWSRGGNIGIRSSVFEVVGGWHEERLIGEDVDFCWRIQLAGYELHLVEDAVMRYRHPSNWRKLAAQQFRFGINAPRLYEDFSEFGASLVLRPGFIQTIFRLMCKFPTVFISRKYRNEWIGTTAGSIGRFWGIILLQINSDVPSK